MLDRWGIKTEWVRWVEGDLDWVLGDGRLEVGSWEVGSGNWILSDRKGGNKA